MTTPSLQSRAVPTVAVLQGAHTLVPALSHLTKNKAMVTHVASSERCLRLTLANDSVALRQKISELAHQEALDCAFVAANAQFGQDVKLIAMDVDSTFIDMESLDEMARLWGVGEEVAAITHSAMNSTSLDYATSLRARLALMKGAPASLMDEMLASAPLMPGVKALVNAAHTHNVALYLVTSGFTYVAQKLVERLKLSGYFANELEVVAGTITGNIKGPSLLNGTILDASGKLACVLATAREKGIDLNNIATMGDGSNDVKMLEACAWSATYKGKAPAKASAKFAFYHIGWDGYLNLFSNTTTAH